MQARNKALDLLVSIGCLVVSCGGYLAYLVFVTITAAGRWLVSWR